MPVEVQRRGATVVSDRWYHSSLACQGTGAERDWIATLNARARRPDLTLFLQTRRLPPRSARRSPGCDASFATPDSSRSR